MHGMPLPRVGVVTLILGEHGPQHAGVLPGWSVLLPRCAPKSNPDLDFGGKSLQTESAMKRRSPDGDRWLKLDTLRPFGALGCLPVVAASTERWFARTRSLCNEARSAGSDQHRRRKWGILLTYRKGLP
jgi:hypothetical protein